MSSRVYVAHILLTASQNNGKQEEGPGKEANSNPERIHRWWLSLPPFCADQWTHGGHFHPDVVTWPSERFLLPGLLALQRCYLSLQQEPAIRVKRAAQCVLLTKGFWLSLSMASTSERLSLPMRDLVEASTTEATWQSQGISYIVYVAPLNKHIISPGSEKPLRVLAAFEDCADLQG